MREHIGDLWEVHGQGHYVGITTNGAVSKTGQAIMGAGLAKIAALRFPGLRDQLGILLTQTGNHVYVFPDYRLFTIPTKHQPFEDSDPALITRSAEECVQYLKHYALPELYTVRLGCGLGRLDWSVVQALLHPHWDDRFVILTPPHR